MKIRKKRKIEDFISRRRTCDVPKVKLYSFAETDVKSNRGVDFEERNWNR